MNLYHALSEIKMTSALSIAVLPEFLQLISKEGNENAFSALVASFTKYVNCAIQDPEFPDGLLSQVIEEILKGIKSPKIIIRKSWCECIATVFWNCRGNNVFLISFTENPTDKIKKNAHTILKELLSSQKQLVESPLTYQGGPLEGYCIICIAEVARSWKLDAVGLVFIYSQFR